MGFNGDREQTGILFADDEEILLLYGKMVLEKCGYKVILARDGEEALSLFTQKPGEIALAILDLVMPGLGGLDVMRKLREMSPGLPVIISSGYDKSHIEELAGETIPFVLPKNFTPPDLEAIVKKALDRAAE